MLSSLMYNDYKMYILIKIAKHFLLNHDNILNSTKKRKPIIKTDFLFTLMFEACYPHLEDPQSLQVKQPSWYIKFSDLQESQVCPLACVPSST